MTYQQIALVLRILNTPSILAACAERLNKR